MAGLLRTETITYEGATITVQCPTLLTGLRKSDLEKRMVEAVTLGAEYLDVYLNCVVQTQFAEGLPFTLPAYVADADAHQAAFEQFLNLPGELQVLWHNAALAAAIPPGTQAQADEGDKEDPKENGGSASG